MARTPWYEQDRPTTLQYEITATADKDTGEIHLRDTINTAVLQVIKTQEEAVQKALIQLGWTPPQKKASVGDDYERRSGPCWDILYRTPYLVVPKLALISMPLWWQKIFVWLAKQLPDTPEYYVHRKDKRGRYTSDPWANYRHSKIKDVMECE